MERKVDTFGFVNVDKPSGMTSSAVVNRVKWLTGLPCGHMGTLDPLAGGVLPVGVGNATRLFEYFLNKQKEYVAEFTFGVTSDTLDSTGELIPGGAVPAAKEIAAVLPRFVGKLSQIPPRYSAKNINGRRGYDLARAGVDFELPPKEVTVYSFELLGPAEKADAFRFRIRCGGGTYIRSLARDVAEALGTKAVMSALRRTQSGCFEIGNAIAFEALNEDTIARAILPTERVLPFETLVLPAGGDRIFHGVPVRTDAPDGSYKIYRGQEFYGIAEVKAGRARIGTKLC